MNIYISYFKPLMDIRDIWTLPDVIIPQTDKIRAVIGVQYCLHWIISFEKLWWHAMANQINRYVLSEADIAICFATYSKVKPQLKSILMLKY